MLKPWVVTSHDYSGMNYFAEYNTREEALRHVENDMETVRQNLLGYEIREFGTPRDSGMQYEVETFELYVSNSDIFYEWEIHVYGSQNSAHSYIDFLDSIKEEVEQEILDWESGKIRFDDLPAAQVEAYVLWLKGEVIPW